MKSILLRRYPAQAFALLNNVCMLMAFCISPMPIYLKMGITSILALVIAGIITKIMK